MEAFVEKKHQEMSKRLALKGSLYRHSDGQRIIIFADFLPSQESRSVNRQKRMIIQDPNWSKTCMDQHEPDDHR